MLNVLAFGTMSHSFPPRPANPQIPKFTKSSKSSSRKADKIGMEFMLEMEDYFTRIGVQCQVRVDGRYRGWVNPELMERYNIAPNAEEAWNKNGGGNFSYRNIGGSGVSSAEVQKHKAKGWSQVKAVTATLMPKNPNAYFYRHVEPGVEQWMGDWTEEEHHAFINAAFEFGCGDKWGLFSTYIPHRVGYQCSNYYRAVILKEGFVWDTNYMMTHDGEPQYVGQKKRPSQTGLSPTESASGQDTSETPVSGEKTPTPDAQPSGENVQQNEAGSKPGAPKLKGKRKQAPATNTKNAEYNKKPTTPTTKARVKRAPSAKRQSKRIKC